MDQTPGNVPPSLASEADDKKESQKVGGTNPVVAIIVAVVIALALAGISLLLFLRSGIRHSDQLTSKPSSSEETLSETPDDSSELKSDDLDSAERNIQKSINAVNGDEFGSSEMSDSSLGL